jgi:COP9 signalosome complex subunit 12
MKTDREGKGKDRNTGAFPTGFTDDIIGNANKNEKLEQAAWVINRMFTICLSDRSELTDSRKWGIYSTTNLLFKTYFQLNSIALTKNVLRALAAAEVDLPPLTMFPKSHRCTFKYYRGVIDFLQENYSEAEANLSEALVLCHKDALKNREQILTYLIPAHVLIKGQLPTAAFLAQQPMISRLFGPIFVAIRSGNLLAFDQALAEAEPDLVHRRIYLTLERTRDLCMRNLFRKVFLAAGWEEQKDADGNTTGPKIRRTRIKIEEFEAAMRVAYRGSDEVMVDRDEVECFLANMIYKVRLP